MFRLSEYLQCPYRGKHLGVKWEPGTTRCCYCQLPLGHQAQGELPEPGE